VGGGGVGEGKKRGTKEDPGGPLFGHSHGGGEGGGGGNTPGLTIYPTTPLSRQFAKRQRTHKARKGNSFLTRGKKEIFLQLKKKGKGEGREKEKK